MDSDNVFGHKGVRDAKGNDFRLQHPFSLIVAGTSNSGKSIFVKMLLENAVNLISEKIENIVIIYECWQKMYEEISRMYKIKFIEGIPQTLNDDHLFPVNKTSLLILDDVMRDAS